MKQNIVLWYNKFSGNQQTGGREWEEKHKTLIQWLSQWAAVWQPCSIVMLMLRACLQYLSFWAVTSNPPGGKMNLFTEHGPSPQSLSVCIIDSLRINWCKVRVNIYNPCWQRPTRLFIWVTLQFYRLMSFVSFAFKRFAETNPMSANATTKAKQTRIF